MMYYGGQSSSVRFIIIFLTVLALPALYFGLEIFQSLMLEYLWRSHAAQHWPQVPAKVLQVDWVWHQAQSKTGGIYGKDMRVAVRYEYSFGGNTYHGQNVGFEAFAARNENLYRFLADSRRDKRSVTAWVNPDNPAEAVLDPQIRWLAIVVYTSTGGMLIGIGGGLLFLAGRAGWPSKRTVGGS